MNDFKEDSTFFKINSTTFYVKGYEEYNVKDRRKEVSESIDIVNVRTQEKIVITQENYEEFEVAIRKKTDNFTEDDLKELHKKIINYEAESSNQIIAELIRAISADKKVAIEVIKEDNEDFGRLVRSAAEYHLANQMNYVKVMKKTKSWSSKINTAEFVVSNGKKVIKSVVSDGLKKGMEGAGKEFAVAYVKRNLKKKGKKLQKKIGGTAGALLCTAYFINEMEEYIKKSEDYFKTIPKNFEEAEKSFKTLFWHLLEEDYLKDFIKKNREDFKKGWLNKRVEDTNYLASILKIVTINGLFEENFDEIEEFLGRSFEQHITYYLLWDKLNNLKESIKQVVNPFNYTETFKNLTVKKVSEFFSVWNIALIELMGQENKYIGKPVEVLVNDYLELVKKYQNVSKLSQLIIKIGVVVEETSRAVAYGIGATAAVKSMYSSIFCDGTAAIKSAVVGVGAASIAFAFLKHVGKIMVLYASTIAELIYLDGENLNTLIPLFEYFASEMDIDFFNINTNSLETLRINKEWPEKIADHIDRVVTSKNFKLEIGDINNLKPKLVKVMTTVGIFEEYYMKHDLNKDIERLTLYYTDREEEIKEQIKDLFYYQSEEEHQDDLLEYERLITENMEERSKKISEDKMKEITNLVTNQSLSTWYGKEEFEKINKEIFENIYNDNLFYITYGKKEERFEITNLFIENTEKKSPFEILKNLYEKTPEFYEKYIGNLVKNYENNLNENITLFVRDKVKQEEYNLISLDRLKNHIEQETDIKFYKYKDIFLYSEYSYYIDKNLVGEIKRKKDYDYILVKYNDSRELLLMANNEFRDLFLNLRGSIGIDNRDFVHQNILNEIDVEYKEKSSGDEKELDELRGYGILKWRGKRLGEKLEFAYEDNKWFWEKKQEFKFEVFKDQNNLLYFYNRRNNFLKIKYINENEEDLLVTIRNFNNCDYGIEIPKKIVVQSIEELNVGGAKVIETYYYETSTYSE